MPPECCASPRRLPAQVDRLLPEFGLRLRYLPGEVCLSCREVSAPHVFPTEGLERAIARCLQGSAEELLILKARPRSGDQVRACSHCEGEAEPSWLDVGLGPHAGLVTTDLRGWWCWRCGTAIMPEEGQELRGRLARVNFQEEGSLVPSLLYDTPEHPSSLQLEVTTRCNLRCEYCSNRHLEQTEDLALERFRRLLDRIDLRRVDNVDFTGLGESVLHLQLPEMVREILRRAKPTQLRVVTNGTALTPKRFEPLCEAGITSIAVSVDSLDPEKFARARTGGRLSQVLENLEALVAYRERRRLDGLQIKIKAVLLGDPYGDAEALLAYSARHGLDMPHFSCLDTRAKARSHYRAPWMESAWAEEGGAAFGHWAEHRWRELTRGRPVPAQSSEPSPAQRAVGFVHPSLLPSEDLCRWAVDAAFVSVDGQCLSCCEQMIDLPRLGYGSLESATLAQLWTGALLWGYRLPLSLGAVPSGCVGCPWAPPDGVPMEPSEAPRSGRTMLSE